MCRKFYTAFFLTLCLALFWHSETSAQSFPYHLSVESIPGQCYDDARLIFTLTDDNGNVVQIDPQTHNAVNTAQYPLYNVQYHYKNVSVGGVQFDYSNDIMLVAGTYCVGVSANVPAQGGYAQVDTTFCNVQLTTSYNHLEAAAIFELASSTSDDGRDKRGYHPSFHCADMGRIQLHITQGVFPYVVTILDEQQDTVVHEVFYHRVNSGTNSYYADYRDYYNFDNLPIGTYTIKVSDSCGYVAPLMTFTIPDAEPVDYMALVHTNYSYSNQCPDATIVKFEIQRESGPEYMNSWANYMYTYFDSVFQYRFINPGNDTTQWRRLTPPGPSSMSGSWTMAEDTLPNYCVIFYDTIKIQFRDLCHDTLMTYSSRYIPQFKLVDSIKTVNNFASAIDDTCAIHLLSGDSTQSFKIYGGTWEDGNKIVGAGWLNYVSPVSFRYYRCPLSYNIWSMPDSILLGHAESEDFTGLGAWVSFDVDTVVPVHISVTDAQGCQLAEKDTVLVFDAEPIDDLFFWFECHNDKDDDGRDHCCEERYLWIQEHGVNATLFRQNMTLRLIESPLYNHFNFTATRQNGVWTVTPDDTNNHSTYVDFSYSDGWRATVRDSVCLPPGRYTFEIITDCEDTTITYEWAGFFWDSIAFTSPPQYEFQQVCDHVVVTQVSTGLDNYIYFIDPAISNDEPIQEECPHAHYCYSPSGISSTKDALGRSVLVFSIPGTYYLTTYSYNDQHSYNSYQSVVGWCTPYVYYYDTITIAFSYLDFEMASALLCDASSTTGIVSAKAVNGNPPYTYTLYDQPGTAGNVVASNSTGYFDNIPMTVGQQFSVQVTDSCLTSFSVNVTAVMLTQGSLFWETGAATGEPHLVGDTAHLTALTSPPPASYLWTGPNGFTSTSQAVDIVLPDTSYSGWYYLQILNSFCGSVIADSIFINVVPAPQVIVLYDTVCQWAGYEDNGFTLSVAETSVPGDHVFTILQQSGYYADTLVLHLTVNPSVTEVVEVTALGSYTWHGVTYTSSGAYTRTADGCSREILLLTITDTLGLTIVADDDSLCRGENTTLHAQVANAYVMPPVAVGDILCTDGDIVKPSSWPVEGKTALGVVFHVDTSGAHGWAVHLHDQGTSVRWVSSGSYYADIPAVVNCTYPYVYNMEMNGHANTGAIREVGSANQYPAAWAVDFPNGWYLPAIGQLRLLYGELKAINSTLQLLDGTPFLMSDSIYYWSSTEQSATYAFVVRLNGAVSTDLKYNANYVRGVRDF